MSRPLNKNGQVDALRLTTGHYTTMSEGSIGIDEGSLKLRVQPEFVSCSSIYDNSYEAQPGAFATILRQNYQPMSFQRARIPSPVSKHVCPSPRSRQRP